MGETHTDKTQKPSFQLPGRQWEYLLSCLEEENIMLFIGPGILPFPGHESLEDALCEYLQQCSKDETSPFIEKFYRDDKFFMLNERDKHESLWNFMGYYRDFFKENKDKLEPAMEVLRKLAAIPFTTIMSSIPNTLIEDAFGDEFSFHTDFYNKKQKPEQYIPGTKNDPLIYYLRGKMDKDESMVISHNDLFDYLESIYEAKSIQPEFKAVLKSAKYYVFLGLPLESWYMQLIMRLFEFHVKSPRIMALKRFPETKQNQKAVYEDLYKVKFYESESIEFIDQLYEHCSEKGILKVVGERAGATANFDRDVQVFRTQLSAGHPEKSIKMFEELVNKYLKYDDAPDFFNTMFQGVGAYNLAKRQYNITEITFDKFEVAQSKLTRFLSSQVEELKTLVHGK